MEVDQAIKIGNFVSFWTIIRCKILLYIFIFRITVSELRRDPQSPLSVCYRPPGSVQSGASLTGTVDSVDSVRVQEPRVVYTVGNALCSQNLGRSVYKMIYQYKDLSMEKTQEHETLALVNKFT